MDLQLTGTVYVLSGASRGLGLATAQVLAEEGATVVLGARSPQVLDVAAGLGGYGVVCDLADPAGPARLVEEAVRLTGRLDGALISVGGPPGGTALGLTDAQWQGAFDSVFLGPVRLCRAAVEAGATSLALVLSTSAKSPIGSLAASNGLRPGLAMLAKTMADELGPQGVRVNGLLPGRVDTDRVRELDGPDPAVRAERAAAIPLRRYGDPAEFGRVAAFVLSPAASYLTGAMIPVDGGAMRSL